MMNIKKNIYKTLLLSTAITFISPMAFAMLEGDDEQAVQITRRQHLQLLDLASIANRNHASYLWLSDEQADELQRHLPTTESPTLESDINGFNHLLARFQRVKGLQDQLPDLASIATRSHASYLWLSDEQADELQRYLPTAESPTLESDINGFNDLLARFQKVKSLQDQLPDLASIATRSHASYLWLSDAQRAELQRYLPTAESPTLESDINGFNDLLARFQRVKGLQDQLPNLESIATRSHAAYLWLSYEQTDELQRYLPTAESPTLESDINGFNDLLARFQAEHDL